MLLDSHGFAKLVRLRETHSWLYNYKLTSKQSNKFNKRREGKLNTVELRLINKQFHVLTVACRNIHITPDIKRLSIFV